MNKETLLEIGVIGAGVVALVLFLRPQAPPVANATSQVPSYLSYNQNTPNSLMGNLPQIGSVSPGGGHQPTCSCGGGNISFAPDLQTWADNLANSLTGYVQEYEQNVFSQVPEYVSQFFKDPFTG